MIIVCKNCSNKFNTAEKHGFVCNVCDFLNPLSPDIDYFVYLSMPYSLDLDQKLLEAHYIERMIIYHPDKYVNKTEEENYSALIHSSYLNSAYTTLSNKLEIIAYLYKLYNKNDIITEEKLLYDNSLMIEFFDLYEEMYKVTNENKQEFLGKLHDIVNDLILQIKSLDFCQNSQEIQVFYIKIRYLNRIQEKLLENLSK